MAAIGNFYNTLEFGTINSGDYGVYITGTGVYNAPARAVEMVSVPGRNGDVPIDMGHWDNIEVTYKCGLFGIDQSEMGEALMEFRNAIASQIGYQRLSDSYNPNEFRLGLFMAGLEFDAVSMNRAGEFELKFNCKPQRFLTDGEEMIDVKSDWSDLKAAWGEVVTFDVADDVSVEYGVRPGVLVNPTQYESSPVIEIEGTGDVNLNDYVIAIDGGSVGEVELASERRVEPIMGSSYPSTITETIDLATTMSLLEDGDAFNISTLTASWLMGDTTKETYTITQQPTDGVASIETATSPRVSAVARFSQLAFAKGEARTFSEEFIVSGQSSHGTGSVTFTVGVDYDGSHTLTISYGVAIHPLITGVVRSGSYSDIGEIIGNSSKQTFSGQVIIDSETGDAYRIEDGTYISLNKYIQLGAQLPTLRPGANIITYDDTITSLKIAPRWWRL